MSKIIIGCDPDSKASGIAVYKNGNLDKLECMPLIDIMQLFKDLAMYDPKAELHIENVNGISAAFTGRDKRNGNKDASLAVKMKMAQQIGMCKQAQIEIERAAKHCGVKVVHHKVSKMWKDSKRGKAQLKLSTGYDGRSNEDTRSAAYFGWLGTRV